MDLTSIIAIALAVLAAVVGWSRAAGASSQLATVRDDLEKANRDLEQAQTKLRKLEKTLKLKAAEASKPAPPEVAEPERSEPDEPPEPEESLPPEPEPEEPEIDPKKVKRRAEKMLKNARLMARHVGFDNEIDVKGEKGVRVAVPVEDELDEVALAYLHDTSDAVLDVGEKAGEHFLIVRG